jgi:hypothetical protein
MWLAQCVSRWFKDAIECARKEALRACAGCATPLTMVGKPFSDQHPIGA